MLSLCRWIVILRLLCSITIFLPATVEAMSVTQSSDKEADVHNEDSCLSPECDALSSQTDDKIRTNCPISPSVADVSQSTQSTHGYQVVPYVSVVPKPLLEIERRFEFAGLEWVIEQQWDQIGLAAVVWEAAIALCQYLESKPSLVAGRRVIELGSGTGLAGMVASALGAHSVWLTDRLTSSAEANLGANRRNIAGRQVTVSRLEWGRDVASFHPPFDVVLAADVVYSEETFPLLIKSLSDLSSTETTLLLACKQRHGDREATFFRLLSSKNFRVEVVWLHPERNLTVYNIFKQF